MLCYLDMQHFATGVPDHDEGIEGLEPQYPPAEGRLPERLYFAESDLT